jgi:radical SAM superfamily enzyme YgiQ (UPF0313 family)
MRSPESVADDIEFLFKVFGVHNFFIVDSIFNADEGHMVKILERIVSLNLEISFSCYLQPKISEHGIFRLLKRAGCVAVDFGADSGSSAMLDSLKKAFTPDDIRRVSNMCREAEIDFCHSIIFGGPGETEETIRETVALMDEISPKAIIAMTGVRIYPGTEMEQIALQEGILVPGKSLLEPNFYFSEMGPDLLLKKVFDIVDGRKNWFFPGQKDWSSTIGYKVLQFLYRKGPLWRTFKK